MPVEYWKMFIEYGKPGTLMPSFPKERSGFLTPEQVSSLLDYLVKVFPKEGKMVYHDLVRMERTRMASMNAAPAGLKPTNAVSGVSSGFAVPPPKPQ